MVRFVGKQKNAFYISSDSINENLYTKIVIPLNASYFSDVPADYNSGIFIKSAFKDDLSVSVDEIRFCFTAPSDPGITSGNADVYNFSDEIPSSDYCSVTVLPVMFMRQKQIQEECRRPETQMIYWISVCAKWFRLICPVM